MEWWKKMRVKINHLDLGGGGLLGPLKTYFCVCLPCTSVPGGWYSSWVGGCGRMSWYILLADTALNTACFIIPYRLAEFVYTENGKE